MQIINSSNPIKTPNSRQGTDTHSLLYSAQTKASSTFQTGIFPCYSSKYIESQEGFKKIALRCYKTAYDDIDYLGTFANHVFTFTRDNLDFLTPKVPFPSVLNSVFPINPINGQRHFIIVPKKLEKFLGDYVIYPLSTLSEFKTNETLHGTDERMADRVNTLVQQLVESNQSLVNPEEDSTQFDYRMMTVASSKVNAFATPGGGMVIFSQLIKEIESAIRSKKIQETVIQFADGSSATVNLKNVTLDDVLGSLIGHEMTHIASRHSNTSSVKSLFRSLIALIAEFICSFYIKKDQVISSKGSSASDDEDRFDYVFDLIMEAVDTLLESFDSKQNEYEADITGAFLSKESQLNPLGALFLIELLEKSNSTFANFLHKHFEFILSHPCSENRKRALFAAIQEFDPEAIEPMTTWTIADSGYDLRRSSPGISYAKEISTKSS